MPVTVTDICCLFNVTRDKVRQQDTKQLFVVDLPNGRVLVSYKTIIGKFITGIWYITTEKYSVTTSKQTNQFISSTRFPVIRVDILPEC